MDKLDGKTHDICYELYILTIYAYEKEYLYSQQFLDCHISNIIEYRFC